MLAYRSVPRRASATTTSDEQDARRSTPRCRDRATTAAAPPAPTSARCSSARTASWYTEDWATTLGHPADGRRPARRRQLRREPGRFGEPITVCRWQSPDVAWVLGEQQARALVRACPARDDAGRPAPGAAQPILRKGVEEQEGRHVGRGPDPRRGGVDRHRRQPRPATPPASAARAQGRACTSAPSATPTNDGRRHAVVVRRHRHVAPDRPARPRASGTGDGDRLRPGEPRRGVRRHHGRRVAGQRDAQPTTRRRGTGEPLVNGLPEAAVEDLVALQRRRAPPAARRRSPSRGVWELRLDAPTSPTSPTCAPTTTTCATASRAVATQRDGSHGALVARQPRRAAADHPRRRRRPGRRRAAGTVSPGTD